MEDGFVRTDTYKGDHEKTASTILQSKTFFFTGFGKGDEIADYSEAFRTDGTTIRSTSYIFYSTNAVRESADCMEYALVRSGSYKGDHEKTASTILQSKTFFFTGFGKGDEIADYSEAFRTDGTTI